VKIFFSTSTPNLTFVVCIYLAQPRLINKKMSKAVKTSMGQLPIILFSIFRV